MLRILATSVQRLKSFSRKGSILLFSGMLALVGRAFGARSSPIQESIPDIKTLKDDDIQRLSSGALKRLLFQLRNEERTTAGGNSMKGPAFADHDSHVMHGSHGSFHSHGQHTSFTNAAT